ncbi:Dephospho-CoA kinase [Roseobacter fucihabitans]|uniref:Dephospho-CoA kinase n=1 Tax=Roseobacter fucihabitans TaxID=1537242 RepID=A0ABZ2C3A5_9RHOB|nr:dephospho-CoA kinase [Roseobacter litoralis]MBC6963874.1 Dephospho-CoA kinase [Roseobacter litoralis]MBC6964041.1 Dephospho-CoA kinase [Roseobacter litoralis]
MTFKLGLTGSIGMGKSTTAQLFSEEGCGLWDADAAVHRLYDVGGAAVGPLGGVFPAVIENRQVSREKLRALLRENPDALKSIEVIVHPLVAQDRNAFLAKTTADIVVLDIPLLFETGGHTEMDAVACVTIPPKEQKARVMARGTMTREAFEHILSQQMPIEEKSARSDFVIVTDTIENARSQVQDIVRQIRERIGDA